MPSRRANPNLVKLNFTYTVTDLAARLQVHKNTIRDWGRKGLEPIDRRRPLLFTGAAVREFLTRRNKARKRPCAPGTIYCFKCREPRKPALGMVDYKPKTATSGNLHALCEQCGTAMHRGVAKARIRREMPRCDVQMVEA